MPVSEAIERIVHWRQHPRPGAKIAMNMRPIHSSWGGGNQWAGQMVRALRAKGYSIHFHLDGPVDCIVLIDPRRFGTATLGWEDVKRYKDRHPEVVCLHRINENDQRKGTEGMDALLAQANQLADQTIFISEWLRDYHAARWFDLKKPHSVIRHGADPHVFHPHGSCEWTPDTPFRLVTHHWSDHWMKGFRIYEEIDQLILDGSLPQMELWVIGRWPRTIRWRAARTFGPARGVGLARLLRSCHAYVTGSIWEPGGMHMIEGAQCGLPALYHLDGGGIVEIAEKFGIGYREDVRSAILQMKTSYQDLRRRVLQTTLSGERMCEAYQQVIQQVLDHKRHISRVSALAVGVT